MPYTIFLSHASADLPWVQWIAQHAQSIGVAVYLHEYDPQPGRYIAEKVQAAIRASDVLVVLLTHNSQFSPYVQQEIGFAQGISKEVIPLVQPGIGSRSLAMLEGREYIAFDMNTPQAGIASLLADLQRRKASKEETAALVGLGTLLLLGLATTAEPQRRRR